MTYPQYDAAPEGAQQPSGDTSAPSVPLTAPAGMNTYGQANGGGPLPGPQLVPAAYLPSAGVHPRVHQPSLPGEPIDPEWLIRRGMDGKIDLYLTAQQEMPCTDVDSAAHLAWLYEGKMFHATGSGRWFIWNGHCQQPDTTGVVGYLAMQYARAYREALRMIDKQAKAEAAPAGEEKAKELYEMFGRHRAYKDCLLRNNGQQALTRQLAAACAADDTWLMEDRHPSWLNFADVTVHLDDGSYHWHLPQDMFTYALPYRYLDPNPGGCPLFFRLVDRMTGGDHVADHAAEICHKCALNRYLLRALGHSLVGGNPEHLLFIIDGPTNSGKSVVLQVGRTLLGALGHPSQAVLITRTRDGSRNARVMNSIRDKRIVTITETERQMVIDVAHMKDITGEAERAVDEHYARTERRDKVTYVIWVATNELASMPDPDGAAMERLRVIPGGETIPVEQRDRGLAAKIIEQEGSAILQLLVAECAAYHQQGLLSSQLVEERTARYFAEQETVPQFIEDTCYRWTLPEGAVRAFVPQNDLWTAYRYWGRDVRRCLGRNQFYDRVAAEDGITRNEVSRRFEGIVLNPEWEARVRWAPQRSETQQGERQAG